MDGLGFMPNPVSRRGISPRLSRKANAHAFQIIILEESSAARALFRMVAGKIAEDFLG